MNSKILKDHFINPQNLGVMDNPDYQSIAKSDSCNDVVKLMIKVNDGVVSEVAIQVYGCGYCIAGSSLFTVSIKGGLISDAAANAGKAIDTINGDLSEHNKGCVSLPLKAFAVIYENYLGKN